MYFLLISFFILIVTIIGAVVTIISWGRIEKLEKDVLNLFLGLNDKNYKLWKQKLKAEEEVKRLRKSATLKK